MSIFDRFVSKETGEQERKSFHPTPYRKMFSVLDTAGKEVKAQYPDDSKTVDDFVWALKEACRDRYKKALEGEPQPMKAEARFFLSKDRMSAYACLLPPENEGDGITLEEFLDDIHFEGINYGILQEEIQREFELGYLHIFLVARGKLPQAGEDGKVTEFFQRRRNMRLEVQDGSQVDFGEDVQLQPIRKGTVICLIRPPKPGTDGMDVAGQRLPSPPAVNAYVPQGKNTAIGRGGLALIASVDGILYIENDQFCIHAQKIIDGDLDHFQGTLQISGNLYIAGNVDGGVEIEASGEIVINGKVGQARVTSMGGTIRVQQGIYGTEGKTFIKAACQVQSPVVEQAEIDAGTSVIAEAILNSVIRCGGTVHVMSGRGIIADSLIRAGDSILCLRIGNLAGGRSQISVGYPPHIPELWERTKAELSQVQSTIEMLWNSITDLRKKGSRMSDGERSVLEQLVEQRDLYVEKRESLTTERRALNKELDKRCKGRIRCEKLYPFLEVQFGRLKEEVTTIEENCKIHVEENRILLK
ncbi:MAG: DUF342 domain-containing protein [Oscillospiraceae bacterium]|nr:DUF342 domain-containing protein [Oscillospiraceae bacterium]